MKSLTVITLIMLILGSRSAGQSTVAAKTVSKHIGETITVCEKVFSGKRADASNTILLDLGGFHPNQQLVVIIPAEQRNKFKGHPEVDYDGKDITVTGKVIIYKGKPAILVQSPTRLKLVMIDNDRVVRQFR